MSLRVLITNHALAERAGTELYVRDVAEGLLHRGHTPIAYSTRLGEVADELRKATVPVVDNLASLSVTPDLIHGQGHVETMTALLHFAGVPAISFCHGWLGWLEAPPRFPRILRYVAVDDTCRDRLVYELGIPEQQIRVIRNFVDLQRFKMRSPLPERPQRALVFSNYASEATHLPAVREACERAGIALDVVGFYSGSPSSQPESLLGRYDIVFAKARCAFEALAVGTAVVLCDAAGLGPMVTTGELDKLKRLNFGIRTLRYKPEIDVIIRELARYDPLDAAEVMRRIRATSGADEVIDQIVELYEEVLDEHGAIAGNGGAASEGAFAAAYVRGLAARMSQEREAIYRSTSYRVGNFLVRTPLLRGVVKKMSKGWHQ